MSKMNDFEKAKVFIADKNNSLTALSKELKIPLATLNRYRANPDKLKKVAWERVHELAALYDKK